MKIPFKILQKNGSETLILSRFYDKARWRKLSLAIRHKEPLCRSCLKVSIETPATQVDHIIPLLEGGAPFSLSNLQPLCKSHHWKKTKGVTYNTECDIYGLPMDPDHPNYVKN